MPVPLAGPTISSLLVCPFLHSQHSTHPASHLFPLFKQEYFFSHQNHQNPATSLSTLAKAVRSLIQASMANNGRQETCKLTFLDLPPEIRNRIYLYTLHFDNHGDIPQRADRRLFVVNRERMLSVTYTPFFSLWSSQLHPLYYQIDHV